MQQPLKTASSVSAHVLRARGQVNDFAFKLANVNGTGSASANSLLMQAIFRMGIPVSGKNLFPSNIQGLPTWYEIRVNRDGHTSRTAEYDLMVAMNAETYARDIAEVRPGGWVLHDATFPLPKALLRADVTFLEVPFAQLCNDAVAPEVRQRTLMKNICYVGTPSRRSSTSTWTSSRRCSRKKFSRKPALRGEQSAGDRDRAALRRLDHFACPLPTRLEKMDATKDSILIDGKTATALGCVYAGATVAAWYPITPSTSVLDGFTELCARFRTDKETGERNYCILQAEDELAAIGMVIGASWMGARAFTSTAGPGISLMNELLGLAYYSEIPAVIVDVQRVGPSTGMPTRTQQGDILLCAYASHGDTRHILLFPADPGECFYFAALSFDLAERFQTPVFLLTDLDIGMNDWVTPRLQWDDAYKPDRGRVLSREDLEKMPKFYRYSPEDENAVAARTLPGVHAKGAFFTRGSGHNKLGGYTEIPDEYQDVMDRLARKHKAAREHVPAPVFAEREGAEVGVVTLGGCDRAVREALEQLEEHGIRADYMRVRGFPFSAAVEKFLEEHAVVFVVEQNRDAQLRSLLTLETPVPKDKLRSVLGVRRLPAAGQAGGRRHRRRAPAEERRCGVSYIKKPVARHPSLQPNALGLTVRDYEGSMSTLCAGCGHDSITAAIVRALYELDVPPHKLAKLSGIGCSSKTPTYFVSGAHGFNSAHGRMPAIASGAAAANRDLTYIGVSGDGDSLSIGLGQMIHAMRRNVRMLYVIENNGVYGLTKGQFSASSDIGSKSKKGEANTQPPIDPVMLALNIGATFVARSFSGDKAQLVPILKAALRHDGFALVDVISPCVTFNDHEGSTKSYLHTRKHQLPVIATDFVPHADEITTSYDPGATQSVRLHDGSVVNLHKVAADYDPTNRTTAWSYVQTQQREGRIPTGLLYLNESGVEMHAGAKTTRRPLVDLGYAELCPGSAALAELQEEYR